MTRGVIVYNAGVKMIVRLATMAHSLRKHYDGPLSFILQGKKCQKPCKAIARRVGAEIIQAGDVYAKTDKRNGGKKNAVYVNACLCHTATPYDTTVWLDSDTTVHGDFSYLFEAAERHEFAVAHFADWRTDRGQIRNRLEAWRKIEPELVDDAIAFGPAINCGVFAFSDSELMDHWHAVAERGQDTFIPDEVACQLMLPQYPHEIVSPIFNVSCKYALPTHFEDARIIHFHGRKHCRMHKGKPVHHSAIWYDAFEDVRRWPVVQDYICEDKQLPKYIEEYDEWRSDAKLAGSVSSMVIT